MKKEAEYYEVGELHPSQLHEGLTREDVARRLQYYTEANKNAMIRSFSGDSYCNGVFCGKRSCVMCRVKRFDHIQEGLSNNWSDDVNILIKVDATAMQKAPCDNGVPLSDTSLSKSIRNIVKLCNNKNINLYDKQVSPSYLLTYDHYIERSFLDVESASLIRRCLRSSRLKTIVKNNGLGYMFAVCPFGAVIAAPDNLSNNELLLTIESELTKHPKLTNLRDGHYDNNSIVSSERFIKAKKDDVLNLLRSVFISNTLFVSSVIEVIRGCGELKTEDAVLGKLNEIKNSDWCFSSMKYISAYGFVKLVGVAHTKSKYKGARLQLPKKNKVKKSDKKVVKRSEPSVKSGESASREADVDLRGRLKSLLSDYMRDDDSSNNDSDVISVIKTLIDTYKTYKNNSDNLAGVIDILIKELPILDVEPMDNPLVIANKVAKLFDYYNCIEKDLDEKLSNVINSSAGQSQDISFNDDRLDVKVKKLVNRLSIERKSRVELEGFIDSTIKNRNTNLDGAIKSYRSFLNIAHRLLIDSVLCDANDRTAKIVSNFMNSIIQEFDDTIGLI